MGCGGSRHQTEMEGIPIRLHHQKNNSHNDQNKPCIEEDNSSTPKFKNSTGKLEEERYVEGSHDPDYEDEDDGRRICSSSPSFKIYLPENLGQDREKDGDKEHDKNGYDHQSQETIIEKEEAKKGILKKTISKYMIMMSKKWR